MLNRIAILFILSFGIVLSAHGEQEQKDWCPARAVADPGFEMSGRAGKLVDWGQGVVVPGAEYAVDKNEKHSGEASYRISSSKPGAWGYMTAPYINTWKIKAGVACKLSTWIKAEGIPAGGAWISLQWRKPDGSLCPGNGLRVAAVEGTYAWRQFISSPVVMPAGISGYVLQAGITPQFSGTVWLDDIGIETAEPLACEPKTKSLIGSWTFDEGDGSVAKDISGCGNNGTIHNPEWQKNADGKTRLLFDKDTYVEISHSYSLILPDSSFSLEVLFKPLQLPGHQVILFKGTNADAGEYYFGLFRSSLRLIGSFQGGGGNETYVELPFKLNAWNHLIVTGDGCAARIYLNGKFQETWLYSCLIVTPSPLLVGYEPRYHTSFSGFIKELKLYNYPLSRNEVKTHHQQIADVLKQE